MRLNLRIITFLLFGCLCLNVGAQRIKKLKGEESSIVRSDETLDEAKKRVLNTAILKAMAEEFGTLMMQSDGTVIRNKDGISKIDFESVSTSLIGGELISIEGEPEYKITYPNNELWCNVKVTFRARERVIKNTEIEAKIYRKGKDDKSSNIGVEGSDFISGEQLIMSFRASADGYLTVYLEEGDKVFCLLPYRDDDDGKFSVEQGEEYILFSRHKEHYSENQKESKDIIEEYEMTSSRSVSQNVIHILFSPNEFSKALDKKANPNENPEYDLPNSLSSKEFQKWIGKRRTEDIQLHYKVERITIKQRD